MRAKSLGTFAKFIVEKPLPTNNVCDSLEYSTSTSNALCKSPDCRRTEQHCFGGGGGELNIFQQEREDESFFEYNEGYSNNLSQAL